MQFTLKNALCVAIFSCICLFSTAQEAYFEVKLWEQGLPNTNGSDFGGYGPDEVNYKPTMRVFLPQKPIANGKAIVCFPGGGYAQTNPERYGETWAPFYNKLGIAFIVLHYRMPKGKSAVTISDAIEAYKQTKLHAKEWGINPDKIGIQGVSAGGHLASTLATHYQEKLNFPFQILIYPVITLQDPYTHKGSRDNFIGKMPEPKLPSTKASRQAYLQAKEKYNRLKNYYSNELQVTARTPRAFIAASDDDRLAMNSILYYAALNKNKVPAVLHSYPSGGHGWHINTKDDKFAFAGLVEAELKAWLESF